MSCIRIHLHTPLLSLTDYEIGQGILASTRGNTYMYGRKLLYNVDASPIVPHIIISRLVDHAIFLVANSALMCEPDRCELLDKSPLFFSTLIASPPGVT